MVFFLATPGEPLPTCYTLALAGDVMLGRGVAQSLDGDWEAAFAAVTPTLSSADVAFANLESPLTTAPQVRAGHDLRAAPAATRALSAAGFDVLSLANNHALDAGPVGLAQTERALASAAIAGVAHGETYCTDWLCILAFDDTAAPLDLAAATASVTAAAAAHAPLVVVSVHWGGEYQAAPSPRQEAVAQALVAAGADLVVGHGPHVLQRVEWIAGAPVVYSLGNFLFDQPYPADCRQAAVLLVTVCDGRVCEVEVLPTTGNAGRVQPAAPQDAAAIHARLRVPPAYP
ncbi:MAG: CapA family protein [Anaerolineae bacterium]|nr:CapA family protein [Anaerolineae bacterium]